MPTQEITDQLFFGMKHAPETPTLPNNTNGGDQMVSTFFMVLGFDVDYC